MRDQLRVLVVVGLVGLFFMAVGSCVQTPMKEHFRFSLEDDCKNHCEVVSRLGRVDWQAKDCVCGEK